MNSNENVPIRDRLNMAFMSTLVTYGRGTGVVVNTGMDTEIGKIADLLNKEEDNITPLQRRLASLGKTLGFGAVDICIVIFIISMFQGRDWFEMLLTAICLAVAAIPEGLPAIVAIVLAMGVQRMIKQNSIVKPSIALCKQAGITPIMISGDHKNTAFAIASELDIAQSLTEYMRINELFKLIKYRK